MNKDGTRICSIDNWNGELSSKRKIIVVGGILLDAKKRKWLLWIMILSAAIWSFLVTGLLEEVEILLLPFLIVVWLFFVYQWTKR